MPLCHQVMIEPLEKWDVDFVGPINPTSLNKTHILVYTDFVTKWVEAKAISLAIENVVVEFLFSEIFTRFGVTREIVIDNRQKFISNMVQDIMDHLQENG